MSSPLSNLSSSSLSLPSLSSFEPRVMQRCVSARPDLLSLFFLPLRRLRGELERRRSRPLHLGMSALPPPTTETDSGQRRTHARFLAIKGAGKTSSPRTSRFTKPNPSSSDHRACQPESKTANSWHQRSDPSTSTAVASASMEMEQLTARFNDVVAVHGNN
jgi:hypothetical protein|uniref:Uncharacterized protein n=1 Tax=Oryza sativa subsp. japonica TaxID=39947 RepID=Q5VQ93_ORYSJ|nr:hypothetical protein [Oryza sativa Japonica Group]